LPKISRAGFLKLFLTFALVAAVAVGIMVWREMRGPVLGGDFTLNYDGQEWSFSKNARALNLLYIGYVKCPDVCPMRMSYLAQAFHHLSAEQLKKVQMIFVSVDFAHDRPHSVAEYARQFNPQFVGLTGTKADIQKTVDLFGASFMVEKDPKSYLGYSIVHTDRIFFLDDDGTVIDSVSSPQSYTEILDKIKEHL